MEHCCSLLITFVSSLLFPSQAKRFEVTFRQCSGSSGADGFAPRICAILRERLAEAGALALGQKWESKQSIVLPQSGILRAQTTNLLGAGPTKANG